MDKDFTKKGEAGGGLANEELQILEQSHDIIPGIRSHLELVRSENKNKSKRRPHRATGSDAGSRVPGWGWTSTDPWGPPPASSP